MKSFLSKAKLFENDFEDDFDTKFDGEITNFDLVYKNPEIDELIVEALQNLTKVQLQNY